MRLFASVYYKGTRYAGWQRQPDAITIQQVIEEKLSQYFNREITIYGAGRTDAGVHAFGQKFHFDVDVSELDISRLLYSINMMLPADIKIDDIEEVDESFHARFDAKAKIYSYSILLETKDPFLYETSYLHPSSIDIDLLKEVLSHFVGKHNYNIEVSEVVNHLFYITFRGEGFMRYMIRFIVGEALNICEKNLDPSVVDELLNEASPRKIVSHKAPANGLVLVDVEY